MRRSYYFDNLHEKIRNRQYHYFGNVVDTSKFDLYKQLEMMMDPQNVIKPEKKAQLKHKWEPHNKRISCMDLQRSPLIPRFCKDILNEMRTVFYKNDITLISFFGAGDDNRSFRVHKDIMDVLYLQGWGQSMVSVWERFEDQPLDYSEKINLNFSPEDGLGRLYDKWLFKPGDMVWLPRGTWHLIEPVFGPRIGLSFGAEGKDNDPANYI